ncbi:MAG: tRNA 2-selenouridine(34) synthase MnmH [Peptococcaceae bacterium]|jgi:tRNA 2-selenouridine synthase|nr:tRNA 2-selenouridine(34) synthase MnmH [Peptococcaceae bacterium]MDH7524105.1 tRNA 2-selenouridine(34) synthase MnmH [Peptococcaceae bacterium]
MGNLITIEQALNLPKPQFVDLRSPLEFEEAHIPRAVNMPLLNNEERALIGAVYKERSPEEAVDKGFSLIAPRLPALHENIKRLSREKDVVLYCWRGGMRSEALSQVLNILGTKHFRLEGGYKSFRRHVMNYFERDFEKEVVVLDGLTGVGKTELLKKLKDKGLPAVDLEGIAGNRGSVFGHLGLPKQPTQKHFEGLLYWECFKHRQSSKIVVECESRRIGSVLLPTRFFEFMQKGIRVLVYDRMEKRVERLIATYAPCLGGENEEQLKQAVLRLKKRLGGEKTARILQLLEQRRYDEFVEKLLVDYYDPLYRYPAGPSKEYETCLSGSEPEYAAEVIRKTFFKD